MSTKYVLACVSVLLLVLAVSVSAQIFPGHQFWGDVLINGDSAPDGTEVIAQINGADVASTTTSGGKYGFEPDVFYVSDPDNNRAGEEIRFYIEGTYSDSHIFENGGTTQLNQAIAVSQPPSNPPGGSSPPGGGTPCVSNWECTDWSSCVGGTQTRTCVDVRCGRISASNKPEESQSCTVTITPSGTCVSGQRVCAGDDLYECQSSQWVKLEGCSEGCDDTIPGKAFCLSDAGDNGDEDVGPGGPPTGLFFDPAATVAIVVVVILIIVGGVAWTIKSRRGGKVQKIETTDV